MKKTPASTGCHCGQPLPYAACCGRYHHGELPARAEQLMRSRYSAFVLQLEPYLLQSWASDTRPVSLDLSADDGVKWLGLQVLATSGGAEGDDSGTVEFVARYKVGGRAYRLHETSRFCREDGAWRYIDGDLHQG